MSNTLENIGRSIENDSSTLNSNLQSDKDKNKKKEEGEKKKKEEAERKNRVLNPANAIGAFNGTVLLYYLV